MVLKKQEQGIMKIQFESWAGINYIALLFYCAPHILQAKRRNGLVGTSQRW